MRERSVERYLREKVKEAGGWAIKFAPAGTAGVPDRIVIWPGGRIDFVECKTFGGTVGPLQQHRQEHYGPGATPDRSAPAVPTYRNNGPASVTLRGIRPHTFRCDGGLFTLRHHFSLSTIG